MLNAKYQKEHTVSDSGFNYITLIILIVIWVTLFGWGGDKEE
jgi:hypothetical protein